MDSSSLWTKVARFRSASPRSPHPAGRRSLITTCAAVGPCRPGRGGGRRSSFRLGNSRFWSAASTAAPMGVSAASATPRAAASRTFFPRLFVRSRCGSSSGARTRRRPSVRTGSRSSGGRAFSLTPRSGRREAFRADVLAERAAAWRVWHEQATYVEESADRSRSLPAGSRPHVGSGSTGRASISAATDPAHVGHGMPQAPKPHPGLPRAAHPGLGGGHSGASTRDSASGDSDGALRGSRRGAHSAECGLGN